MPLINNGIEPTYEQIEVAIKQSEQAQCRYIRTQFDAAITSQEAKLWICVALYNHYTDLAAEMRADLETEIKK